MNSSRFFLGIVFLVGVVAIAKGFWKDVKESTPPPREYKIFADMRVADDKAGMQIKNGNDFSWTKPVFIVNGVYRHTHPGSLKPGQTAIVPFDQFQTAEGAKFPGVEQFHDFDIATATMSLARRR